MTSSARRRNGGQATIDALVRNGVDTVFGIPGTHNLELYREIGARSLRHITPRHEQSAGYAADGYARTSGRPGVVVTTSGPGLTNAITAAATAYADSIPLLVISPGITRGQVGGDIGWLHEMKNQSAALDAVVQRSVRVESASEIGVAIDQAFADWTTSRPRPVHLEIPLDVLEGDWDGVESAAAAAPDAPTVDRAGIERAAELLRGSRSPVILAGGGAVGASREVTALAEMLQSPVVTSVNGKGVLDESHALSLGASLRLRAAQTVLDSADVLLIIGSEVGDSDLWGATLAPSGSVIRIDVDPLQLHKNVRADVAIQAAAAPALQQIVAALTQLPARTPGDAESGRDQAGRARSHIDAEAALSGTPWREIQAAVSRALPDDAIIAGDSSQISYYGTAHYHRQRRPRSFLYPTGFATLGYGLPAAIGAKTAAPDRTVIALVGDGAFQFSAIEVVTAAELGLGIPIVVVNNRGYREIRDQEIERGIPPIAVDIAGPRFADFGVACGGLGYRVSDIDELPVQIERALERRTPTVIEVPVP